MKATMLWRVLSADARITALVGKRSVIANLKQTTAHRTSGHKGDLPQRRMNTCKLAHGAGRKTLSLPNFVQVAGTV